LHAEGRFGKQDFRYVAEKDNYICPAGEALACSFTTEERGLVLDHGVSGAKGRDKRPQFDALCRDATQRKFDLIMAWSVDRLGRSLQDLVAFLSEIHALKPTFSDCTTCSATPCNGPWIATTQTTTERRVKARLGRREIVVAV
jgi:hypothetical protein